MEVKRISPPPLCFSCGRSLPEKDYDIFHQREEKGENPRLILDEMNYPLACCRRMFLGDDHEYRRIMALYDLSTLNDAPHL